MNSKIKIQLGKIQETLLLPLWGRAVESKKVKPKLIDKKAVEIIDSIDYDFSTITENISWITQLAWVARSLHVDKTILNFLIKHPEATIINIGCGLDTTFERIDNGRIHFYDLDLPDVIELRRKFFWDNERRKALSGSFLENDWLKQVKAEPGLLIISAGVFYYFEEDQIKSFFMTLANHFESCELFFDRASPLGARVANKKVIKDGGMDDSANLKWGIKTAKVIETWDHRIRLIEEFPMFRGFKMGYSLKVKYGLWISDFLNIMSMVHLRIENK